MKKTFLLFVLWLWSGNALLWARWFEVHQTPYDGPIESVLGSNWGGGTGSLEMARVADLMRPIRKMPHRKARDWQTPETTRKQSRGDCKAKSVLLLAEMKKAGDRSAALVIGRRAGGELHCWLEWNREGERWVLDPSFYSKPVPADGKGKYVGEYAYRGGRKFAHMDDRLLAASL